MQTGQKQLVVRRTFGAASHCTRDRLMTIDKGDANATKAAESVDRR